MGVRNVEAVRIKNEFNRILKYAISEMIFEAELGNALILREYYFVCVCVCVKGWVSEAYTNPAAVLS